MDQFPDLENVKEVSGQATIENASRAPLKILLLGSSGMLGRDLLPVLLQAGHQIRSPFREDLSITNAEQLEGIRKGDWGNLDLIINCAAYTAVDKAESEMMAAMKLNAVAPGLLAVIAFQMGARLLHFSTDFVFDGQSQTPYTESSQTGPINVYGKSKLLGEQNVFKEAPSSWVIRTSWLYGLNGKCFPRTMIEAWESGKELKVVDDQIGCPTSTKELAHAVSEFINRWPEPGLYHAVGPESMSWFEFAQGTLEAAKAATGSARPIELSPLPTAGYPTPAKRPIYSVLDSSKFNSLGIKVMPTVLESLIEFCGAVATENVKK